MKRTSIGLAAALAFGILATAGTGTVAAAQPVRLGFDLPPSQPPRLAFDLPPSQPPRLA